MPTMDEYLAMMQPDPEANRKARIFQALGGLGAGLLGGGGWQRGLARGGLLAHDAMNDASNRASSDQMAQFKMRAAAQEMADKDAERDKQKRLDAAMSSSFMPGSQGSPEMGPPTMAGAMQPAVAPSGPSFDVGRYISQVKDIDPARALQAYQSTQRDSPFDKPKPEHYTPGSVSRYAQTRNYADLVPIGKPPESLTGKINPSDFTPASVQSFVASGGNHSLLVPVDKRPITNVKVSNVAETEESKAVGKARGEEFMGLQKSGTTAGQKLANLSAMEALLKGVDTNALTPAGMTVSGIAKGFGVDIDPTLPRKQAADAIANKFALDARSTADGAGMPGAMSDKDREFLRAMNPNLAQTSEGRALLIEVQKRQARRQQEIAKIARNYRGRVGKFDEGFYDELQQYADANPLFADLMQKQSAQQTQQPGGRSAGGTIRGGASAPAGSVLRFDANGNQI